MGCHIVLGLGFGDEGKGITTDYLCSKLSNPIVVRFSGGHQAGHTVMLDDKKHIHSSFGSGTLRGIPSYFSEHTCFYLPNLVRELQKLESIGIRPELIIHPLAKMTTPYDVAWNRKVAARNGHGSVGVGIGCTMSRHAETGHKLYAQDLKHSGVLAAKMKSLSYKNGIQDFVKDFIEEGEIEFFEECCEKYEKFFQVKDYKALSNFDNIVFEGSQGIMLDMDHGIFPNVTYAHTTSRNAVEIINKIGHELIGVFYVTRCYQTRHGNGWMSNTIDLNLINNEEEINTPNEYQGTMRFGEIDYKLLQYALDVDNNYLPLNTLKTLMVTCVDQIPGFKIDQYFLGTNFNAAFVSTSPKSKDIRRVEDSDLTDL